MNSKLRRQHDNHVVRDIHAGLLWPLMAVAMLLVVLPAIASSRRPSKWDTEASQRKADYIFLEASHRKALDENDAYFDLLKRAVKENPADKMLGFSYGFYQIMVSGKDSATIATGYDRMRDYFYTHPEDFYNSVTYGRVSEMLAHPGEAREVWRRLHMIYPERTEVAYRYAEALLNGGDSLLSRQGIALYDSLEVIDGKDVQVSNAKIRYYLARNDTAGVYAELATLLTAFPHSAQISSYAGDVHSALGDKEGALSFYRNACAVDSTDGYAFYSLANFYNSQGDTEAYRREIINALRKNSLDLDTKLQILKSVIENDHSDDMMTDSVMSDTLPADTIAVIMLDARKAEIDNLFKIVLDEHPHEPDAYKFYASYLMSISDFKAAAEMLVHSLELDPADEEQWIALISLDIQANDPASVERDAKSAMHYFPTNGQFPLMLSAAYQQQKRHKEALKMLDKAESLTDSADVSTLSAIVSSKGDLKYAEGDRDKAFEYYRKAIELYPQNLTALNNCAYYLACEDRDLDDALAMIKKVVEARPDEPTSLDTYAWVLFKLKRYPEAREMIDKAMQATELSEMSAEEYDHAGDIYFMNGDRDKALEYWKEALRLDPDNASIKRKVKNKTIFFD